MAIRLSGIASSIPRQAMDIAMAPLVALVAYVLFHQKGIGMIRDGWALWEGAVSLATGHGYAYFSGNPVIAWPPLYSAYLALWVIFLGPTGWSLLLSNGLLAVLQVFFWNRFIRTMARQSDISISVVHSLTLSLFLGLFSVVQLRAVLSYNLLYVLLPLYLSVLWRCFCAKDTPIKLVDILLISVLGSLLLLTHNAAIAFVVGGTSVAVLARAKVKWSFLWSLVWMGLLTFVVPIAIWSAVRGVFHQTGSHYVGFGAGNEGPLMYAYQLLVGPGSLLITNRIQGTGVIAMVALLAAVVMLCRNGQNVALRFCTLFVLVSSAALYMLFNVTWIYSAIAQNTYILFIPLMLGPLAYITAISLKSRLATVVAVAATIIVLAQQFYWAGMWATRQYKDTLAELGFPISFMSPESYISPTYRYGPPVLTDKGVLISSNTEEEPRGRRE